MVLSPVLPFHLLIWILASPEVTSLNFRASISHPCPEETVYFICSTPGDFLRWKIVFSDNTVEYQTIQSHSVQDAYTFHHRTVELSFRVVSAAAGPINSTLTMRSTWTTNNNTILNNTKIECEDSTSVNFTYYKIPGAPPRPSSATVIHKMYGRMSVNITLTWDIHADRIDRYYLTTNEGDVILVNQSYRTANIVNVPYNMNITTAITAGVCGLWGESLHSEFDVVGCEEPYWPGNGSFTTMVFSKAPGSLITFSCNEGLFPMEAVDSVCQDNGEWVPDLTAFKCHIPSLSEVADFCPNLTNYYVAVEAFTVTVVGLEVKFRCKEGFVPRNEVTAVCVFDHGTWLPDPNGYECNRNDNKSTLFNDITDPSNIQITSNLVVGATSGAIILIIFLIIILLCVVVMRRRYMQNNEVVNDYDSVYGIAATNTIYDTINPNGTLELSHNEAYFKLTMAIKLEES